MFRTIGIIGTGKMGRALALSVVKGGYSGQLLLANRTEAKAEALCASLGCGKVSTNLQIAQDAELILLCVKPQIMEQVLGELSGTLKARQTPFVLCSVAAGLSCDAICAYALGAYPVIRLMPNTPVSVGCGMIQLCSKNVSQQTVSEVTELLQAAGCVASIDESLMDAACAVSGCGPAFAYLFAEALADGGVSCGLPRKQASLYAAKMLEGAAKMLLEGEKNPGELKDDVCSPGGSTIEGVYALECGGFRGTVMEAVRSAYQKTRELGEKK